MCTHQAPQFVLISVLCVFVIVGNSCVLAAIRFSENGRKSRMNFFIMHLAIADLLVGIMVTFADLVTKVTVEWYAGYALCKLVLYAQTVVTYSSTYMLVSLSIDRYDAVARPMNFSRSGLQGRFLVIVSWILSLIFAAPTFYLYNETLINGKNQCWMDFPELWHWQLFISMAALVTFILPAIIIATCYIAIIYIIWSKGRCHEPRSSSPSRDPLRGGNVTPSRSRVIINDSRHDTGRGIIPQAKIRTIKMTLIIVIVFILCWSPFFIYNLLDIFNLIPENNAVSTLVQSAAPLNSAANPIIYGIFSTRICKNLRQSNCEEHLITMREPGTASRRIPVPSCLRHAACRCKDKGCKKRNFRGRNQQYFYSQSTDHTLSTLDANRRITDLKLSSLKRSNRLNLAHNSEHLLELHLNKDAVNRSKKNSKGVKMSLFKLKGCNFDSKRGQDCEVMPLTRHAVDGRKLGSDASEESSQSSEKVGQRLSAVPSCCQDVQEYDVIAKHDDVTARSPGTACACAGGCDCLTVTPESKLDIVDINLCGRDQTSSEAVKDIDLPMTPRVQRPAINIWDNPCSDSSSYEFYHTDAVYQDNVIPDHYSTPESQLTHSNITKVEIVKCPEINLLGNPDAAFDDAQTDSYRSAGGRRNSSERPLCVQFGTLERSLAHRRPSGVPSVRRRLTEDENNILNNAAGKWLLNDVTASESSVV
ncbi:uncharacterized protein LOC131954750 [Physella acuta]|uniref:uncharacterized protein LOC131954750 n=1 Tax=Physella acuta TaxID=109671 RepID=UPI0027DE0CC7|nr:uncharacterized protein LOC131954750 [Physella acuta]